MDNRIIVLGVLRSGTSLCTALIHRWGAYVGHEDELFSDQYGYMEHLGLQELNDELLDGEDLVPPADGLLAERSLNPIYKGRALQILHEMDQQAEKNQAIAWVWKDPRLPAVLPFWTKMWGDAIYVIPIRHPMETILSGAQMEGIAPEDIPFSAGFSYWQFNMLNVLLFTQPSRRKIFIAYDQLIQNPTQECARLCHFLDIQCNNGSANSDQMIESMASEIMASQRHYHEPGSLADMEQTTREQRVLYNFLRVKTLYADETFNKDDFALYPGWREYLQTMNKLRALGNEQES